MSDVLTVEQRHRNMSAIHSTSTKPELRLRNALWLNNFRYRVNNRHLPGKPDIVLPKYHTVIFVHGCFWHGHRDCKYYSVPKTNTEFWTAKVERNRERDQEVWRKLEAKGWFVIIVWECQLKKTNIDNTVERVSNEIIQNGERYRAEQENRKLARDNYRKEQKTRKNRETAILKEVKSLS